MGVSPRGSGNTTSIQGKKHWRKSPEQIPGRASLPAAPTEAGDEDAFTAAHALLQHPGALTSLSPYQYLHQSRNLVSPFCVQSPGAGRDAETLPPTRSLPSTLGQRRGETLGQQTVLLPEQPKPPWLRQMLAWQGPELEHPHHSQMEMGRGNIPTGDSGKGRTEHLGYGEGKIIHLCEKGAGEFNSH